MSQTDNPEQLSTIKLSTNLFKDHLGEAPDTELIIEIICIAQNTYLGKILSNITSENNVYILLIKHENRYIPIESILNLFFNGNITDFNERILYSGSWVLSNHGIDKLIENLRRLRDANSFEILI